MKRKRLNKNPCRKNVSWIKENIKEALTAIMPAIGNGEDSFSDCAIFSPDFISSWDENISMSMPFKSPFAGGLPAKELLSIINKLHKNSEISIKKELAKSGENIVVFKSGTSKTGLILNELKNIDMPAHALIEDWNKLPGNFLAGLEIALFSCATDSSYGIFTNIAAHNHNLFSTDDHRLTRFYLSSPIGHDLLIPHNVAKLLIKYNVNEYYVSNELNMTYFRDDHERVISFRQPAGQFQYKEADKVFDDLGSYKKIKFPKEIKPALERAAVIASGDNQYDKKIELLLKNGKLKISSAGFVGWYKDNKKIKYKGETIRIIIPAALLIQILNFSAIARITENHLFFNTEDFDHLVLRADN